MHNVGFIPLWCCILSVDCCFCTLLVLFLVGLVLCSVEYIIFSGVCRLYFLLVFCSILFYALLFLYSFSFIPWWLCSVCCMYCCFCTMFVLVLCSIRLYIFMCLYSVSFIPCWFCVVLVVCFVISELCQFYSFLFWCSVRLYALLFITSVSFFPFWFCVLSVLCIFVSVLCRVYSFSVLCGVRCMHNCFCTVSVLFLFGFV